MCRLFFTLIFKNLIIVGFFFVSLPTLIRYKIKMKKTFVTLFMVLSISTLFAQNPLEGFTQSKDGVWYKFEQRNENGTLIREGDIVIGQASIRLGDSVTMDGFLYPPQPIFKATLQQKVFTGDLMEGLFLMKTGEICTFAFAHDSIAKAMQLPEFFKVEEFAFFRVKVDSVTTEEAMRIMDSINMTEQMKITDSLSKIEEEKISKYLKENGYKETDVDGIYFKSVKEGNGKTPANNDNVQVNYVGRFLDGRLFDTSVEEVAKAEGKHQEGRKYEPLPFTIGKRMMIEGFERGVKMMKEGGKAIIVIPSSLAYGGQQRGEIAPYSSLVFELELVKVEKNAPATTKSVTAPKTQPVKQRPTQTK
jgi:FKBP-type peptidyl-prolyl cis-trans isomerase